MGKLKHVIFLLVLTLACSCEDTIECPKVDTEGYPGVGEYLIQSRLNVSSLYSGANRSLRDNLKVSIYLDSINCGRTGSSLGFSNLPLRTGQIWLKTNQAVDIQTEPFGLFVLKDNDVAFADYYIDTNYNNWVNLEVIDTISSIVKGTFEVRMILEAGGVASFNDTLLITNGQFDTKIIN